MYEVEVYETESGNNPLRRFIENIPVSRKELELAQIISYIERLKKYGLNINQHHPNSIKPIRGEIKELRPGNNRILFFGVTGNKFVLLHGFEKKVRKTPKRQIERAENEMKDYLRRNK